MKSGVLAICTVMLVLLFLGACNSGISKEEYNGLKDAYNSLKKEHNKLLEEHDTLKTELKAELESVQREVQEYKSRLEAGHASARFFDMYVDTFRLVEGVPTKYGYAGFDNSPEYKEEFLKVARDAGGTEFEERVIKAFSLPRGEEKDKAWAEFHVYMAENLLAATEY